MRCEVESRERAVKRAALETLDDSVEEDDESHDSMHLRSNL